MTASVKPEFVGIAEQVTESGAEPLKLDPRRYQKTIFEALLDARGRRGGDAWAVEDAERQRISFDKLVLGAMVLGGRLAKETAAGEHVGVMLPNSLGVAVTFFGLQAFGRIPAMLNFSAGVRNIEAACAAAEVETVITARRFIELAKLEAVVEALEKTKKIIWLDDLKANLSLGDKLKGLARAKMARSVYNRRGLKPTDVAVILFTSGTEGTPKGVALTHQNVLSNTHQADVSFELLDSDIVFNPLPVFHSFGLTAGMILPLVEGLPTFLYPSPLHYRAIPPLVRESKATILFGTDTFLTGYARASEGDEFETVRLLVAGAERVKDQTRALWADRFGLAIFEGYGCTEMAPVVAVNTFRQFRPGSVGPLLPGIEHRLEPVPGLDEGGRLMVRGPNTMAGYYTVDEPGKLKPPAGGWHDTGDIVHIDEDGFVHIRGRAKRFAKIGGEMVSLAAIEAYAAEVWPDNAHAVVAIEDPRKGEQLVLVTDHQDAARDDLLAWSRQHGVSELMIPKRLVSVDSLPVLGTGKLDYVSIRRIAEN